MGCYYGDICMPADGWLGIDGTPCPPTCPAICDHDFEMHCHGGIDPNGCYLPDICVPYEFEECPMIGDYEIYPGPDENECPEWPECDYDWEIPCPGEYDYNGCYYGDYCIPAFDWFGIDGTPCPPTCPAICDHDFEMH